MGKDTTTIKQWVEYFIGKYPTKEDFKIDLDSKILELEEDKENPNQVRFLKRVRNKLAKIDARLEYLREEIECERISYGEIAELQYLAKCIDSGDILLLQWAGVPEFEEES